MTTTPCSPTTLWQAEEADREAAERARVAEWVAEHPDPVTAALARAEAAEVEATRLREGIEEFCTGALIRPSRVHPDYLRYMLQLLDPGSLSPEALALIAIAESIERGGASERERWSRFADEADRNAARHYRNVLALTAENARLRAGIEVLHDSPVDHGGDGLCADIDDLYALLNPPTEGGASDADA